MTFDFIVSNDFQTIFVNASTFENIYSKEEQGIVVDLCTRVFNRKFNNGACVRLESCSCKNSKTVLAFSLIGFFDFLTTNYLILNFNKLYANANEKEKVLLEQYKKQVMECYSFDNFTSIIENKFLSNILAVSCVIYDDKNILLTKRNGSVGISNDFVSTSVTGSVDSVDYESQNPIYSCCKREVGEELNFYGINSNINLTKIVCGQHKLQPIALVNIDVSDLNIVVESIQGHEGFFEENSGYYVCQRQELPDILTDENIQLTEAARTHLEEFADGRTI